MKNSMLLKSTKVALKTCPLDCMLMLIIQLLISCLPVGQIYVLGIMIEQLPSKNVINILSAVLGYCIILWLQREVQDWYNHYFLTYFSLLRFEKEIKKVFFQICRLMKLDDYNDAEVVNHALRAKNASVNILRLYQAIVEMICTFISVFVMGFMVITINKKFLIIFIVTSFTEIIDNIFVLYQNKKIIYENTQMEKEEEEIFELLISAKSLKEIILLNSKQFVLEKWRDVVGNVVDREKNKNRSIFAVSFCMKLIYCMGMLYSYFMLLSSFSKNEIEIGQFAVIASAYAVLRGIFNSLFSEMTNVSQFAMMVSPFFDYVDIVNNMKNGNKNDNVKALVEGNIYLNNVNYTYHNSNKQALHNIDLVIEEGKKYVIVGENGSGKTTLIKLILGLYTPTEGEIFVGETNIYNWDEEALYKNFSDVPQEYNMYSIPVRDNLYLYCKEDINIDKALREMDLTEMCNKLDFVIGKEFGGIELSGGQKQKIAILRAENKGGDFFFMDEPTSAIDPLQEKKIFERIHKVSEGKTTIIVSHRLSLCKMADCIIVMKQGEIEEIGTHNELMKKNGVYSSMYNEQAQLYKFS